MTAHGHVHWNELNTHDAEAAKAFYGGSLGWTYDRMDLEAEPYWIAKSGDRAVGGIFTMSGPAFEGVPDHWLTFFAVDDVDAAVSDARAAGGEIVREPRDMPQIGRLAIVRDAGGAIMGWITPAPGS